MPLGHRIGSHREAGQRKAGHGQALAGAAIERSFDAAWGPQSGADGVQPRDPSRDQLRHRQRQQKKTAPKARK